MFTQLIKNNFKNITQAKKKNILVSGLQSRGWESTTSDNEFKIEERGGNVDRL